MLRSNDIAIRDDISNRGLGTLPRGENPNGLFPSRLEGFQMSAREAPISNLEEFRESGVLPKGLIVQSFDDGNRDILSNSQMSVLQGRLKSHSSLASDPFREKSRDFQNQQVLKLHRRQPLMKGRAI